jgi:hypothetical protein
MLMPQNLGGFVALGRLSSVVNGKLENSPAHFVQDIDNLAADIDMVRW